MTPQDDELDVWREIVEKAVSDELDRLAALAADSDLRAELSRVSVVVLDDAPTEEPDLLGQYLGVPVTDGTEPSGQLPPLVQIFLLPLVDLTTPEHLDHLQPDPAELARETVVTVRHEIAHHFGMDHDHLARLGLD